MPSAICRRRQDAVQIIHNGGCPISSREIAHYEAKSTGTTSGLEFADLATADLRDLNLDQEQAARRIHAYPDGKLISGVPAFALIWERMPGFSWLARLVSLPVMRSMVVLGYDWIAAPLLYALHQRRLRRDPTLAARPERR